MTPVRIPKILILWAKWVVLSDMFNFHMQIKGKTFVTVSFGKLACLSAFFYLLSLLSLNRNALSALFGASPSAAFSRRLISFYASYFYA